VGDPGVGKSRLVAEALARIDARVVRGRCLSYGEGITYWPVVEVVKQLDALPSDEAAANATRSLIGKSDSPAGTDEIAWAFRKLLSEQAPLVVCFDDIQWGEETFLELVESTALLSTGAPILLLCMARPELLDRHPGWPAAMRLEPLPVEQAEALVGPAVPDEVRERIVRASGGNPLFLTEMVALAEGGGAVEVPATLRALLAARLDQLDDSERRVLERGAVEGELFHRGSVQALAPEEREVTPRLAALVRRELVRPDRPVLPWEDAVGRGPTGRRARAGAGLGNLGQPRPGRNRDARGRHGAHRRVSPRGVRRVRGERQHPGAVDPRSTTRPGALRPGPVRGG